MSEDGDPAFVATEAPSGFFVSFSESSSDDEVSEDVVEVSADATAGFGIEVADSLSGDEEVEDGDGLEGFAALVFDFLAGAGFPSAEELDEESELESELEGLTLAFRFKVFEVVLEITLAELSGTSNFALAESCSSSASLSELEVDVEAEDAARLFRSGLRLDLGVVSASLILTSESLPLEVSLSPLLLVSFLSRTLTAPSLPAFAFFTFLVLLADLVFELSSESLLLLVSSITVLS